MVQKAGRTVDYLYSFILDGPNLLDGPSGPLGALIPTFLIPIVSFASTLFELLFVALISLLTFAWMPYFLRRRLASVKTEIGKPKVIELEGQIDLLDVLYNRR